MYKLFSKIVKLNLILPAFFFTVFQVSAQTETIKSGSFIVNMGVLPQTAGNALKPYGMIYDLIRYNNVPVKLIIRQTKVKDGIDFTYNGTAFSGGTFIILAEDRSAAVNAKIASWVSQGVVGVTTTSDFTIEVTQTLRAIPRWTLDSQNGAKAEAYLIAAGINTTAFPGAYNWKSPQTLDCCDDFFVMPHADPIWSTHSNLLTWNKSCLGSIWLGCHAGSALSNMVNPADRTQQTNFLVQKDPAFTGTTGNYTNSNSLIQWGGHSGGSVPYTHRLPSDPNAQYMGITDGAQLNGSEQIYMPRQGSLARWNPGVKIIAYDPTQTDVPSLNPDLSNAAAIIAYGRGFDDPTRGYVMYESSHSFAGTAPANVAAQRVFLNFSFFQVQPKAPQLSVVGGLTNGQLIQGGSTVALSITATSLLVGVTFSYQWTAGCGGTFSNPTAASTNFTPATVGANTSCVLTCIVTDNCGRKSVQTIPVVITPAPAPPVANNDNGTVANGCTPGTSITLNVLRNDTDPRNLPFTFTSLNQGTASPANAGVWAFSPDSSVIFTPDANFNGIATITYTITNSQGQTANATISVSIGTADANGCTPNQVYAPQEVAFIDLTTFISQSGTGAALNGTALDDAEITYTAAATDYLNFGTAIANNLIMAVGSTLPLRAKDTINVNWTNGQAGIGTISVQVAQSGTGPWTNAQVFTNSNAGTGVAAAKVSQYILPGGTSGITHIRVSAGNVSTSTASAKNVWLDAVDYNYLSCVSRQPALVDDASIALEDAPDIIDVLANDNDPQNLTLTLKKIVTLPTKGKVSINLDGTVTYISNTDVSGTDFFIYEAVNTQGYASTARVDITITADGCAAGNYKANPPGGAVTKIFQYQYAGTNAATANATATKFLDSKLNQASSGNDNYGTATVADIGKIFSSTAALRPIFYFDVSEIPAGALIQSANFSVYRPGGNTTTQTVNLHALSQSFIENQTTWFERSTGVNWTTAGGQFGGVVTSTSVINSKIRFNWGITSLAQTWVNTPASNFGLLLKTGETLNKFHQFNTKEIGTLANRPQLTITYVIPVPCAVITNRAPLINPDYVTVENGKSVVFNPLTNDTDVDAGNTLSVTGLYGITAGSATFTGTSITYTANINVSVPRTERLTYIVSDNNGAKDTAYVYITVTNAPPSANSDVASTNSGTMVSVAVTSNDSDPEGGAITAPVITIRPKNGTAVVSANNINYTPYAGFTGKDTLIYQICESAAGSCSAAPLCDTALLIITVNNQVPVANNDSKTILPCISSTINLIGNDSDPENGVLAVTSVSALSNPAAGTLINNNDGTVTFTPAVGFLGTVTFTYRVTDNGIAPLTSAPATVSITVFSPVNIAPVVVNDIEIMNMDETDYANVRDNDSDPNGDDLRLPVITVQPAHGTAVVLANGLVKYTPNPGYFGTDTLTYQVCDSARIPATCAVAPPLCATAIVTYTIVVPNTVNAINDENSTSLNTPVSGGVIANDIDLEGNAIIFTGFIDGSGNPNTSGSITVGGVDANGNPVANAGTLTINANGTYTFNPANNFTGVITVPYTITDDIANPATDRAYLRITVSPNPSFTNSIIANNDENTSYGAAVSGNVTTNDRDPQGNPFSVTGFTYDTDGDPATPNVAGTIATPVVIGGTTTTGLMVTNAGTLTLNADGTYTFTPATDFHGSADVPYTICDQGITPQACETALLHIDVLPDINGVQNDPPIAGDDFNVTNVNTPVGGSFINNDSDPNGNPVSLNGTAINTGGPKTPIGTTASTAKGGTLQYYADGTYLYTPAAGYVGPDSVGYIICDVTVVAPQPLCTKAFLHFVVSVTNTTDAINDESSTWQDVNVTGGVLDNDFDAENNTQTFGSFILQNISGDMASGTTISGVDKTGAPVVNAGVLTFNTNGNYTFNPSPTFTGTVTVPYRLCDNGNLSKCDTAYLTITVDPLPTTSINTVIANNDENISYGSPAVGNLFVNDRDPQNDAFTVTSFAGGTVAVPGIVAGVDLNGNPVANAGTLTINANGTYTYTPAAGFVGSINLPYTITDAFGATSTAILHIDVLKDPNGLANDPPIAGDDFGYTTINKSVTRTFISNDSDPNGNPVSYNGITIVPGGPHTSIGAPLATAQGGTLQFYADGTYLYTPPAGYIGPDRVNYQICDVTVVAPQPLCADATIHLLIGPGIGISGKVWDDANGDVIDQGAAEPETNAGGTLFVNLIDGSGNVVAVTPVAANGTYSFVNVNPGASYSLVLSTTAGTVGNPAPVAALPAGWANTGTNLNSTTSTATPGVIDLQSFGFTNSINYDFGIEQLPDSDPYTTTIPQPTVNQFITLNGGANPPALSGSDAEDCAGNCGALTGRSVITDAVPANAELYYNGVLVTNGQQINNFNPSLMQIKIISATIGATSISFQYSFVDAAGKKDPTPATYTLTWLNPLPVKLTSFTGNANNCNAILQWTTAKEINANKFVLEQSSNGLSYIAAAEIKATNSASAKSYQHVLAQNTGLIYYRLKMVDLDGSFIYSPVVTVRTNCIGSDEMSTYPIPVKTIVYLNFTTVYRGKTKIIITNELSEKLIEKPVQVNSSINIIPVNMSNQSAGLYFLYLVNDKGERIGNVQRIIKV